MPQAWIFDVLDCVESVLYFLEDEMPAGDVRVLEDGLDDVVGVFVGKEIREEDLVGGVGELREVYWKIY